MSPRGCGPLSGRGGAARSLCGRNRGGLWRDSAQCKRDAAPAVCPRNLEAPDKAEFEKGAAPGGGRGRVSGANGGAEKEEGPAEGGSN